MTTASALRAMLVDPSLFTPTYDAALTEGLLAAGIEPIWATRPTRQGDRQELPIGLTDPFFYKHTDGAFGWPSKIKPAVKGLAHIAGLITLLARIRRRRPDIVHFQWTVLPLIDALAMTLIRRWCPLVLTVHDTVPFNGERMTVLQKAGFGLPMRLADGIIVHTESGRQALLQRGVPRNKISVVAHGALRLHVPIPPRVKRSDGRFSFLLFGEIKPYKGLDVLVEALGQMSPEELKQLHVVVAGRPRMDMKPIEARIMALGIEEAFELRLARQTEEEIAYLFAAADGFLFPYRQIDASGVWFLIKSLGRWIIASRVGIFATEVQEGIQGVLLPPGDAKALGASLAQAVRERPTPMPVSATNEWATIGARTRTLYESLLAARNASG